jgi:hypothetical protein
LSFLCCIKGTETQKAAQIAWNLFDLPSVLLYIGTMRQGTGHPAEQLQVFLTGLVNPCTMDFVSANGSTLELVRNRRARCMNYFILAKIGNVNMKKTFQKTLIAAAAGVALMSAVGTASANSLLFPYFTTNTGAQSVLTLTTSSIGVAAGVKSATAEALHYVYNYGTGCVHYDANGSMTANDLMSHSIASAAAGGFGKVTSTDASTPVYFPLANQTGFLVVSNKTSAGTAVIRGSMAIVDPSSGLVVSYAGIDNAANTNGAATTEGNFAGITDLNFVLSSLPNAVVTTSWYGVSVGDMGPVIGLGANWTGGFTLPNGGFVWDNDETPYSGAASKTISCAGSIVASDLMTAAQLAAVGPNGSVVKTLGTTTASSATVQTSTGVVLMKLQAVQASVGAPFAGKQFLHREVAGGL